MLLTMGNDYAYFYGYIDLNKNFTISMFNWEIEIISS